MGGAAPVPATPAANESGDTLENFDFIVLIPPTPLEQSRGAEKPESVSGIVGRGRAVTGPALRKLLDNYGIWNAKICLELTTAGFFDILKPRISQRKYNIWYKLSNKVAQLEEFA